LDCSKNIKYLSDLIERNQHSIRKVIHDEDVKKNDIIMEENKININEIDKQPKEKKSFPLNSKGKILNNLKNNYY